MNTVFVPTDFTQSSYGGIALGAAIAEKTKSPLTIHHNVKTLLNWEAMNQNERLEHPRVLGATVEAEQQLGQLVNDTFSDKLIVNRLVTHGITPDEIVKNAQRLNSSVIIMGSHGVEESGRNFIESTVQKVIRSAGSPVILAKQNVKARVPERIVFPCLFNEDVHKPFCEIKKVAASLDAVIHLLFINTPARFKDSRSIRSEMEKFAAECPDQKFVMDVYNHQDVVTGILEHAENIDAGLIALITRDRLHRPQYLLGITETLAFHSNLPILSVNAKINKQEPDRELQNEPVVSQDI